MEMILTGQWEANLTQPLHLVGDETEETTDIKDTPHISPQVRLFHILTPQPITGLYQCVIAM